MLKYIKKTFLPDKNVELYEVWYQDKYFSFAVGDGSNVYLDCIKLSDIQRKINAEIVANQNRAATLEINGRTLDVLATNIYIRRIKELRKQIEFIETLKKHVVGVDFDDDVFSEDMYSKKPNFVEKIKLKLGFKPTTIEELKFYKKILEKKIERLDALKQASADRRANDFEFDVADSSLSDERVNEIYTARDEELASECMELLNTLTRKSAIYKADEVLVNTRVNNAIEAMGELLKAQPDDFKKQQLREALARFFITDEYENAESEYIDAKNALENKENEFRHHREQESQVKNMIIHEIVEYNRHLDYESSIAGEIDALQRQGTSYTRKYRKK